MKQKYLWMVRRAYRAMRHPSLRHRPWWKAVTRRVFERRLWKPCRDTVAGGLAIGLFFAMIPIPFQSAVAAILASVFRVNVPFAVVGCWVTNPLTAVPFWLAQERLGTWLRESAGFPMPSFLEKAHFTVPMTATDLNAASFILGFMVMGILGALAAYPLVHLFSAVMPHHLPRLSPRRRAAVNAPPPGPRSSGS